MDSTAERARSASALGNAQGVSAAFFHYFERRAVKFCTIHGSVGLPDELIDLPFARRDDQRSQAASQKSAPILRNAVHLFVQPLRDGSSGRGILDRHENKELVAAHPGEKIAASNISPYDVGIPSQSAVPGGVTVFVIDVFEPIEIREKKNAPIAASGEALAQFEESLTVETLR